MQWSLPASKFHQLERATDAVKLQQKLVAGARFNGKTINSNGARKFPENYDAHALIQQLQQLPGKWAWRVTPTATLWLPSISVTVLSLNHSLISVNTLTLCHLLALVTALKLQRTRWFKWCIMSIYAIVDWWHVACMWGEPFSVFSLIVLIFLCVRAQQPTIDEVVTPLAAWSSNCIGTIIDISVHCDGHFICTFCILTSRHRSFRCFTWQW